MASADLRDVLSCSICQDTYTDPVTLSCGHNFCRDCINHKLDSQKSKAYSCPDCGAGFRDRSKLCKNIVLAKVIDCLPPILPEKSPQHVLSEPTNNLGHRTCSVHNKILEYFCLDDSTGVCISCFVAGRHQGHNVNFLLEALEIKKRQKLEKVLTARQKADREIHQLAQFRKGVEDKAAEMEKRVYSLFRDLRKKLNRLEMTALEVISKQEKKVLHTVEDLIDHLQVKREELSRKILDIEKMCKTSDHLTILHKDFLRDVEQRNDKDWATDEEVYRIEDINDRQIALFLQTGLSDISAGTNVWIHMLKPVDFLLDVDTVSNDVTLSRDLKAIQLSYEGHNRPETAERFDHFQALSSRVFSSGRHYWVVEISKSGNMGIGVCYPSIARKGYVYIGENKKSWCLKYVAYRWFVEHDGKATQLPDEVSSNRIGIYLDYDVGQLSFYDLTDPIRYLTTLKATFTEPLHAAFMVMMEGYIKIVSDKL
ncbi:E3 ubiquitin-protein ligase TRIM39-like [Phyllobates terribilis]|uniref:E3 ubiquitin-protein ligase TRIM39-like n=1 Tax=Phyllobates terribilis TaxID=111132 RepID=UPI003CCAC498